MAGIERVAVVGAGVIGCAIAFELARRGASVVVFDMREPGAGATQASAGILAPYVEAHEGGALLDLTVRGLDAYDAFIQTLRQHSPVAIEYRRIGTLEVAVTAARAEALRSRTDAVPSRFEWIDAVHLRDLEPSCNSGALGGVLCREHGYVAVPSFMGALVAAATSLGVTFRSGEAVRRISIGSAALTIHTDAGDAEFGRVVLSTGCWADSLDPLGEIGGRVKPIRGQLLRLTAPAPGLRHVLWGASCYIVPWEDGTLLVGATSEDVGFDERPTVDGVQGLLAAAMELLPSVASATLAAVRVGLRPEPSGGLPIIGPSLKDPRLFYALGHFRNGILLAPLTAVAAAENGDTQLFRNL